MLREKAYSSFNISGEDSTLPKSTLKEYADSATRPLFRFLLLFLQKYILNIGLSKRLVCKDKNYDKNKNNKKF